MPAVTELADLHARADAARRAAPLPIVVDADARAAMDASLDRTGLLLLGEMHGVAQTPRVVAALVELLAVDTLALEWPAPLTATVDAYRLSGELPDDELLWLGDGRLTPGHLALLADLAEPLAEPGVEPRAGRRSAVGWLAFDPWAIPPEVPGETFWTARDHAMARRVLDHTDPAGRTLVVAGNAHTSTARIALGVPMGAWLAQERPGLRSVRVSYGEGVIYNFASMPLASCDHPASFRIRLDGDHVLLDHPHPVEPHVPHRPQSRRSR